MSDEYRKWVWNKSLLVRIRNTAQKIKLSAKDFWPNLQFSAELVTFTEEILNGKLLFLCCENPMRGEQK